MSGPFATIDESHAPVIIARVQREPTVETMQAYLDELSATFRKHDRVALIFDTQNLVQVPADVRQLQSDWLASSEAEFSGRFAASAFIITHRVLRGVLRTMFWLKSPYYAYRVVASQAQAWDFLRETEPDLVALAQGANDDAVEPERSGIKGKP